VKAPHRYTPTSQHHQWSLGTRCPCAHGSHFWSAKSQRRTFPSFAPFLYGCGAQPSLSLRTWCNCYLFSSGLHLLVPVELCGDGDDRRGRPSRPRSFVPRVVAPTLPTLAPCGEFTPALFSRSHGVINPARPWVALPCSNTLAHRSPLLFRGAFGWADGDGSLSISVDVRALHRGSGTSLVP